MMGGLETCFGLGTSKRWVYDYSTTIAQGMFERGEREMRQRRHCGLCAKMGRVMGGGMRHLGMKVHPRAPMTVRRYSANGRKQQRAIYQV